MARPAHRLTLAALALVATAGVGVTALPATTATSRSANDGGADSPSRAAAVQDRLPQAARVSGVRAAGGAAESASMSATEFAARSASGSARESDKPPASSQHLVGTWSASSDRIVAAVGGQTIRMVVRTSIGGAGMRLRLSNVFGTSAVTFGSVHLGVQAYGAEILTGTNRPVTFNGRRTVTVGARRAAWSDPIAGRISGGANVVVSFHVPASVPSVTGHERAYATTFLSAPGNHAADEAGDSFTYTSTQWYFLDRIAVSAPATVRSVVAFGDSITDGAGQNTDANRRWTDYLRHRVARLGASKRMGIINAGIAGNRLLYSNVGPSGLSRFERDALSQPGVRTVIVYEGINDISRGEYTSAVPLINAYKRLIRLAHARKVKVLGGTLTPFYGFGTWTPEREEIRQRVNAWIRGSRAFDAVIDFDRAVRDPEFHEQLAAAYDSGDHIHMSDAGRSRLASTVDLRRL
ncbi:SGNH/GDSL hydrolase family protein [Microbispora sp. NPDC049125]|uniref:SGNH/GDSL hydrolase family protein n=1 Tax=Microbispora sp. NPDC049125 TaxID=3154929 RepID=UPI0034665AFD